MYSCNHVRINLDKVFTVVEYRHYNPRNPSSETCKISNYLVYFVMLILGILPTVTNRKAFFCTAGHIS